MLDSWSRRQRVAFNLAEVCWGGGGGGGVGCQSIGQRLLSLVSVYSGRTSDWLNSQLAQKREPFASVLLRNIGEHYV